MRQLHLLLADALEASNEPEAALVELKMAVAVRPEVDRAYLGVPPDERPKSEDPAQRDQRAAIWIRIARLQHQLGDREDAVGSLERAIDVAVDRDLAEQAATLLEGWRE